MEKLKPMYNPPHPGSYLSDEYLEPLNLSSSEFAEKLGINSSELLDLLNETSGITPELAYRLAQTLDTSPEFWLNMQRQRDNWLIRLKTEAQTKTLEKELAY